MIRWLNKSSTQANETLAGFVNTRWLNDYKMLQCINQCTHDWVKAEASNLRWVVTRNCPNNRPESWNIQTVPPEAKVICEGSGKKIYAWFGTTWGTSILDWKFVDGHEYLKHKRSINNPMHNAPTKTSYNNQLPPWWRSKDLKVKNINLEHRYRDTEDLASSCSYKTLRNYFSFKSNLPIVFYNFIITKLDSFDLSTFFIKISKSI